MSFIPWINSFLTFRKNGGGFQVPELDSMGRIRISSVDNPAILSQATPPTITDGTVMWNNTASLSVSGMYFYDTLRSKWLSVDSHSYKFGADSTDNARLRILGVNSTGIGSGYLIGRNICVVGISANARVSGNATKTFDIQQNGVAIPALNFSLAAYQHNDNTLNVDLTGGLGQVLSCFSSAAGTTSRDVTIELIYRLRA